MQEHLQDREEAPPGVSVIMRAFLWISWAGLLFGPASFAGCIRLIFLNGKMPKPTNPQGVVILEVVGLVFAVISVGVVYLARYLFFQWILKRRKRTALMVWYPIGKIAAWAACDGAVFFNLVICLIAATFWPSALTAAVFWLVSAVDMPLEGPFKRWNYEHDAAT